MGGVENPILIPVPRADEGVGCNAENGSILELCCERPAAPLFMAARGGGGVEDFGLDDDHGNF